MKKNKFDLKQYIAVRAAAVNETLDRLLPPERERPQQLHGAMRYSVFAGGKRLRPAICIAACEAAGGTLESALVPAAALEAFHAYTLIHDDLPAMDNDDLRRGKPTLHKAFDEATAILAGDALLTIAFEWLAAAAAPAPYTAADFVAELAAAGGSRGVIAGQAEDMAAEGRQPALEDLEFIHVHKTAMLFRAAARLGAMAAGAERNVLDAMSEYGLKAGLAFQIADDVLNATSSAEALGKAAGTDSRRGKMTYVALYGAAEATTRARETAAAAETALARLKRSDTAPLAALAALAVSRSA